jgi:hypothetical protein
LTRIATVFSNARLIRSKTGVLEVALHTDGGTLVLWAYPRTFRRSTRESMAAVVTRLGLASPQAAKAVLRGRASARAADRAGDLNACERALADVESAIAQAPKQEGFQQS